MKHELDYVLNRRTNIIMDCYYTENTADSRFVLLEVNPPDTCFLNKWSEIRNSTKWCFSVRWGDIRNWPASQEQSSVINRWKHRRFYSHESKSTKQTRIIKSAILNLLLWQWSQHLRSERRFQRISLERI